jgi:group I intron endonuclease
MNFYIYQHRKADTNEIFYVGKGKGTRINHTKGRNNYWHRVVKKHGFVAEYIAQNLDEELAFLAEMECIDAYRRRGIQLVNATDGGEGASGYKHTEQHKANLKGNKNGASSWGMTFKGKKHTEESRKQMSYARIGNKNKLGKKISEESKQKMSQAKTGKPILARRLFTNDEVFKIREALKINNLAQVARMFNVGESTIRRLRNGITYWDVI